MPLYSLVSQHISRNNYSGDWETATSWAPAWPVPQIVISGYDITINGYITARSSLDFTGSANNLIINDTLVIIGSLTVNNNNRIQINDNGILIVRGDLVMENQSSVIASGYMVVTGSLIKTSSIGQGSFTSNDNPAKVFIGGSITPAEITNNLPNFPVLNCKSPATTAYPGSNCSYGNITDLENDQIYPFYKTTCSSAGASSNSPVCAGSALALYASGGTSFRWIGPNDFSSTLQNPAIPNTTTAMSGTYSVTVTDQGNCSTTATTMVKVNPVTAVHITSSNDPMCVDEKRTLTGTPEGAVFTVNSGPGSISSNVLTATGEGTIIIKFRYSDLCADSTTQSISVSAKPVAMAGPDQVLEYTFETEMAAADIAPQRGIWSLVSGSGKIDDIKSPVTKITGLGVGRNIFRWTVYYGKCTASDDVSITVDDPFIPNVITPNGDGKNDYFKIRTLAKRIELTVINRWGITEYRNSDYKNDWDGKNDNGDDLKEDTYFYILNFGNGLTRKGSILIMR